MSQLIFVIEALNTQESIWTIVNLSLFGNSWAHDEKYFFHGVLPTYPTPIF